MLWEELKKLRDVGLHFRRQHSFDWFIVDFYCKSLKLVIEIDGKIHEREDIKLQDIARQKLIEQYGVTFLRVTNSQVYENTEIIINKILNFKR